MRDANRLQHGEVVAFPGFAGKEKHIAGAAVRKRPGTADAIEQTVYSRSRFSAPAAQRLLCSPASAAFFWGSFAQLRGSCVSDLRQLLDRNKPQTGLVISTKSEPVWQNARQSGRIALLY